MTYTVKAGDTLYGISNQFGVSVADLSKLNNVNANNLQVGQILNIPDVSGTNPSMMFTYTVQKGDTLYKIAQKYNTTANELISLNDLGTTSLSIGQVLQIPETYFDEDDMSLPNFISYTVKSGDNLYSIARDNNVSVDQLLKDNALMDSTLSIGQTLKIRLPYGTLVESEECFGPDYTPAEDDSNIVYVVVNGDNLYSIARKFDTNVATIKNLNNLTSNNLQIGQQLQIPRKEQVSQSTTFYTVKKGDNLYKIANLYDIDISELKSLNNLSSNNLSIGQQLKIPKYSLNDSSTTYTVKQGDNLYSIAQKFNTSVDNIKKINKLTSNNLSIGQKLTI